MAVLKSKIKPEEYLPPTREELDKANNKVFETIENNYDNRDFSPLTLHNAAHSFDKFFRQYSYWLNTKPIVSMAYGTISIKWGKTLTLSCVNGSFSLIYKGRSIGGPSRRKSVMATIEALEPSYKFLVGPG